MLTIILKSSKFSFFSSLNDEKTGDRNIEFRIKSETQY